MNRDNAYELQHVALPVAVALVVFAISGKQVSGERSAAAMQLFDDVAHAMAHTVPIYTTHSNGLPKELAHGEVMQGRFERGALLFRTVDGVEYHDLTVQRRDIARAIGALKAP